MIDYSHLNAAQYDAVFSDHPRILCLAGAGTGKTQVLTRRVARLYESGISVGNMLALTFTRAAGAEMKERVISLIGNDGSQLFCNTFHAFCGNVLRENAEIIGYEPDFSIIDQAEQSALMGEVVEDLKLDVPLPIIHQVRAGKGRIGAIQRNRAQTALNEYKYRLRYNNAMDFDCLIEYARELLSRPEIAAKYREKYTHVFIDEFQDTDPVQWELVCKINPANLFIVGDDFQAIYGFRGSDIKIILSLADSPEWQTVKLEINYRCTIPIIAAANALISHNKQTKKTLIARKNGDDIEIITPKNNWTEIENIIPKLKQNLALEIPTAIIARTNKQIQLVRRTLANYGVPCTPEETDPDSDTPNLEAAPARSSAANEIHLMTAHGSKGLEFDEVIIIGANQGTFPNSKGDIQEERRLFYVAMTRTRERLVISSPQSIINTYYGAMEESPAEQSQFIRELHKR